MRPALLALPPAELGDVLGSPGRAQAVFRALRQGLDPFEPGVLAAGLRARVLEATRPTETEVAHATSAEDGTTKLALRLADGRLVETVLIPEPGRTTLCISSQVGCRRGCIFCATATMRPVRHLSADEIVTQVLLARASHAGRDPIRNLVFMGMGEPLDNPVQVRAALASLVGPGGLGFAEKHVTVSTVAPSPDVVRRTADWPARLAWSLHAADDEIRARLVPTARASVRELRDAFAAAVGPRNRPLFVEMTLIAEMNDRRRDAEKAAELFAQFPTEVRFNLLPMNPVEHSPLEASPFSRVQSFETVLREAGFWVRRRTPRGPSDHAACGQLAIVR